MMVESIRSEKSPQNAKCNRESLQFWSGYFDLQCSQSNLSILGMILDDIINTFFRSLWQQRHLVLRTASWKTQAAKVQETACAKVVKISGHWLCGFFIIFGMEQRKGVIFMVKHLTRGWWKWLCESVVWLARSSHCFFCQIVFEGPPSLSLVPLSSAPCSSSGTASAHSSQELCDLFELFQLFIVQLSCGVANIVLINVAAMTTIFTVWIWQECKHDWSLSSFSSRMFNFWRQASCTWSGGAVWGGVKLSSERSHRFHWAFVFELVERDAFAVAPQTTLLARQTVRHLFWWSSVPTLLSSCLPSLSSKPHPFSANLKNTPEISKFSDIPAVNGVV